MQIFASEQWSYRDMPVRYFEPATVYRDEKAGQLSGLTQAFDLLHKMMGTFLSCNTNPH